MKCSRVRFWLLSSASVQTPPAPVAAHLCDCPGCRRLLRRLCRLGAALAGPAPPAPPAVRARLLPELARTPQTSEPRPQPQPAPAAPTGLRPLPAFRAAAALLLAFGLGWLVAGDGTPPVLPPTEPGIAPVARSGDQLVSRFLERDLRLARTALPGEQLHLLNDMAGDLHSEAVHLSREGSGADVALVSDLYGRVVRRGVVGRALALPPQERPLAELLEQLNQAEGEADQAAAAAGPEAAAALRTLGAAARDARHRLDRGEPPDVAADLEPPAERSDDWRGLLPVLVVQGLRLAEEQDPDRRADYWEELTELEGLLRRAGRVLESVEHARRGAGDPPGLRRALTPQEEDRLKELERTLHDLDSALKRMKSDPRDRFAKGPPRDRFDKGPPRPFDKGPPRGGGKDRPPPPRQGGGPARP
jgi:hypothetical protein